MPTDPKIICFRHCCYNNNIFCRIVPKSCPICHFEITTFLQEPFSIPYPYTNAAQHPVSIVIRVSQGTFLNDYDVNKDLHIGLTISNGTVIEFDKQGIIIDDSSKWTNCIAVKIIPSSWDIHWDDVLKNMCADSKWKSYNYDEKALNCFNFVIEFLNQLNYPDTCFKTKEELCEKLLLPKIREALNYNYLFKSLENNTFVVY